MMRKHTAWIAVALAAALVLPATALAGNPHGTPPGQAKKSEQAAPASGPPVTPPGQAEKAAAPAPTAASERGPSRPASSPSADAPGQMKKDAASAGDDIQAPQRIAEEPAEDRGPTVLGSEESTETTGSPQPDDEGEDTEVREGKLTGIANAHARHERNLERMRSKVATGQKKALPRGLLQVFEKFRMWLGIGSDEPTGTPDPSEEPTATPDPSDDQTGTPLPSEDPTAAPEPSEPGSGTTEPTETVTSSWAW